MRCGAALGLTLAAPLLLFPPAAIGDTMPTSDPRLVGHWEKTSTEPCAARYPARLRFEPNGLYFGTTEPPGAFTWWDGGTWQVAGGDRMAISTANDAIVDYAYALSGDRLTFTDETGCVFTYGRLP